MGIMEKGNYLILTLGSIFLPMLVTSMCIKLIANVFKESRIYKRLRKLCWASIGLLILLGIKKSLRLMEYYLVC